MAGREKENLQKQFARAVARTGGYLPRDAPEVVAEKIELVRPAPEDIALDVACGSGTFALALAPRVSRVFGVDLTWEMIQEAEADRRSQNGANTAFLRSDAEQLPFRTGIFSLVTCGQALHHCPEPEIVLKEIARVIKPSGRIGIFDTVAPEDSAKAEPHNRIQRLRDPSHQQSLTVSAFRNLFKRHRLTIENKLVRVRERSFISWMRRAGREPGCGPDADRYKQVRSLLLNNPAAGFSPREEGDDIIIHHHEALFLLRPAGGKTSGTKK